MSIEVRGVTKTYGKFTALNNVDLKVQTGELLALLGPSGSGKTTLLRVIAGMETPDAGNVYFAGQDSTMHGVRQRKVGFVFQHYALFRHMNVFENIAFGLRVKPRRERPSNDVIKDKVNNLLKMVQLEGLANRFPSQLSGGQRQRVALARALAVEPQVLLLDEPFGALDARVRKELRDWLRHLHDDLHITSVFVTHDQEEALEVADRVVVLNNGAIEQIGTPDEVYQHPANPFVYSFLGNVNLFHGRANSGQMHLGDISVDAPEHGGADNAPAVAYVRPHDIEITRASNDRSIEAVVKYIHSAGPSVHIQLLRLDNNTTVDAELTRERFTQLELKTGETVHVRPQKVQVFLEDYSI
jgi:sulfate transport system ATP-binding protein